MNPLFESIIDGILAEGYGVVDNFLDPDDVKALAGQLRNRHAQGQFRAAAVGNQQVTVAAQIRGDEIMWIDAATDTPAERIFLNRMNEFVQYVNQTCYLGLSDYEFHYARYPMGTFYRRHLDRFRTDSRRKLSVICYLNTDWQETDGGQLALYVPDPNAGDTAERRITIAPLGGRLVCFESDRLEHEVLPATRDRLSLTGWLKTT